MNKRQAKKIVFSSDSNYYFDTWLTPEGEQKVIPHSGKHHYLALKAFDVLGCQEKKQAYLNYLEDIWKSLEKY